MASRQRSVVWTERASEALNEALEYIAEDSLQSAQRLAGSILDAAGSLAQLAERGRVVPEADDPEIREVFVHPFRVIYQLSDTEVRVLTVVHQARAPGAWFTDRADPQAN